MIRVKLTTTFENWPLLRQSPGWRGTWGNCQFITGDSPDPVDCWVVIHNLPQSQTCLVDPKKLVWINIEPPSILRINPRFAAQFQCIRLCGGFRLKHPNKIVSHPAVPWWIGVNQVGPHTSAVEGHRGTYDEFKAGIVPPKTKLLSVVSSNRLLSRQHIARANFIKRLKELLGDELDVHGPLPGDPPMPWQPMKWDAIVQYRYHIAIENSVYPEYWTEKLADPFLVGTYPIYHGCPNVFDYFPQKSLSTFDLSDVELAVQKVRQIIRGGAFEESIEARSEARELVLQRYNLLAEIAKVCESFPSVTNAVPVTLRTPHELTSRSSKVYWALRRQIMERWGVRKLLGRSG